MESDLYELVDLATSAREAGKLHEAIVLYTRIIQCKPVAEVYNERGNVYCDLGDYEIAIADYTLGIELCAGDSDLYTDRGNSYLHLKKYAAAIADYDAALAYGPSSAAGHAHNGRGWARWEMDDVDGAIADLQRAIAINPAYTSPRFNLARILRALHRNDEALAQVELFLDQCPGQDDARELRDELLHKADADTNVDDEECERIIQELETTLEEMGECLEDWSNKCDPRWN